MTARLDQEKTKTYMEVFQKAKANPNMTIKQLARITGIVISLQTVYPQARLYFHSLEKLKIQALMKSGQRWSAKVTLTPGALKEVDKWIDILPSIFRQLILPLPQIIFAADASDWVWGCKVLSEKSYGFFDEEKLAWPICDKEIFAVSCVFQCYAKFHANKHVLIHTDNTVALSCLCKKGLLSSDRRNNIMQQMFEIVNQNNMLLSAEYIPSKLNPADEPSHRLRSPHDYMLPDDIFEIVTSHFPDLNFDLASSYESRCFEDYCNFQKDRLCNWTNMFTMSWQGDKWSFYIFPQINLTNHVISFLERHRGTVTAVLPTFVTASWYPKIEKLVTQAAIDLPVFKLQMPGQPDYVHPLQAGKISRLCFLLVHLLKHTISGQDIQ